MAKFVVCRSKEEAMAAAAAGVLWLQLARGRDQEWYWTLATALTRTHVSLFYGTLGWPPKYFAIRVEDDNDG